MHSDPRTDECGEWLKSDNESPVSEVSVDCGTVDKVTLTARSPGKLFSLSMSLLLAAFLQAVRCLTTFIDDTLKNV